MKRAIRTALAIISIIAVTLLFVDVSGYATSHWGWMAKIQLIPALLSLNISALAILIVLTLVFGRIYCSVICPLGIYQDVIIRLRRWLGGKKAKRINRFSYSRPWRRTRLTILVCFVVLLILGLTTVTASALAGLIEPYSAYGRIASEIFAPAYDWVNNRLAAWSAAEGNYLFTPVTVAISVPVLLVAVITMIIVTITAWTDGRAYCNTVCPVGTVLGYMSKHALLRMAIDTAKCNGCRRCERNCKSRCINGKEHKIDHTRCVVCMDCTGKCSTGAIRYKFVGFNGLKTAEAAENKVADKAEKAMVEMADRGRRSFIFTAGLIGGSIAVKAAGGDGTLAEVKEKKAPKRATRLVPPGALSLEHLTSQCTACQLCIQACPENVLRPSTSLESFMQPYMEYTGAYCRPECTACSNVCPAGAILPLDKAEKSATKIGRAVVDLGLCISAKGVRCGNCSRQCPAGAITLVAVDDAHPHKLMPVVNDELCIGCGACEYNCPSGTAGIIKADHSAIHVEGIEIHRKI